MMAASSAVIGSQAMDQDFRGQIPPENFEPGRRGHVPNKIVVHHEDCWKAQAEDHFRDPSSGVSAHGGINLDGSADTFVDWGDTAYHAGNLVVNLDSGGFEFEDGGDTGNPFTDASYARGAQTLHAFGAMFGIPIDREHVLGHNQIVATACPGGLDIDRLIREANAQPAPEPQPDNGGDIVSADRDYLYAAVTKVAQQAGVQLDVPPWKAQPAKRTHVVVSGESLSQIAGDFLGDMDRWPEIYSLNKATIGDDPNLIQPGEVLVLPD